MIRAPAAGWRIPSCLLVVSLAVLVAAGHDVREAGAGPRFTIESTVHDFGTVEPGVVVHHAFPFRNTGDADLHIDGVQAECGCTAATISGSTVPPGAQGSVSVYFDTLAFRGKKTKSVTVSTSDPTAGTLDLTLTGVVAPVLIADPAKLYLGRIRSGTTRRNAVRITRPSAEPVAIASVSAEGSAVKVFLEPPAARSDRSRGISVRIVPDTPFRGSFDATLRITTSDPPSRVLEVPIFGSIAGDLAVQPTHLRLEPSRRAARRTRHLRLRNGGAAPVFIDHVQVAGIDGDRVDYTVRTVRTGYDYRIVLRFRRSRIASGRGAVRIYTTHPGESEIVVPIYAPGRPARAGVPQSE